MNREQAKEAIKTNWEQILTRWTGKAKIDGFICPLCGSGSGAHGTGIKINPQSKVKGLKCFACGFAGDIIKLKQDAEGLSYNKALSALADELGISIDAARRESAKEDFIPKIEQKQNAGHEDDFSSLIAYIGKCSQTLQDEKASAAAYAYCQKRGISKKTVFFNAKNYFMGFDAECDISGKGYKTPRIIFPAITTDKLGFVGRSINDKTPKQFQKMNKGENGLFLKDNLFYDGGIFIVEGAFDALSVCEVGGCAVSLNSAVNAGKLIEFIEKQRPAGKLILSLDNDAAGRKAEKELGEKLRQMEIPFICFNIAGKYKDANEYLVADKDGFKQAVKLAKRQAEYKKPDNIAAYFAENFLLELADFEPPIKTGFENLDKTLGGLYCGLYTIAAIPSIGKTTICHQIADNIAKGGNDVIYFSLEQSRLEMVTKSIAREMAMKCRKIDEIKQAKSAIYYRKNGIPGNAAAVVKEYADAVNDKLSIVECSFDCSAGYIYNYVSDYISRNAARPVVIIDYLQIVKPTDNSKSMSDKEKADIVMAELYRLTRQKKVCVIAISSTNRSSYISPISFESLKESGGIEYTSDVVLGLQLSVMNDTNLFLEEGKSNTPTKKRERIREEKARTPRRVEITILKNRYGALSGRERILFEYFPNCDYFREDMTAIYGTEEEEEIL